MDAENILVITDREELYNKCENMEQLFDKYYLPLLDKHYSKTYQLQQENQELKKIVELYSKSLYNAELTKYKEVIDKAINDIDLVIELIKQQPTEDDSWILDRLNSFKIILKEVE